MRLVESIEAAVGEQISWCFALIWMCIVFVWLINWTIIWYWFLSPFSHTLSHTHRPALRCECDFLFRCCQKAEFAQWTVQSNRFQSNFLLAINLTRSWSEISVFVWRRVQFASVSRSIRNENCKQVTRRITFRYKCWAISAVFGRTAIRHEQ